MEHAQCQSLRDAHMVPVRPGASRAPHSSADLSKQLRQPSVEFFNQSLMDHTGKSMEDGYGEGDLNCGGSKGFRGEDY